MSAPATVVAPAWRGYSTEDVRPDTTVHRFRTLQRPETPFIVLPGP